MAIEVNMNNLDIDTFTAPDDQAYDVTTGPGGDTVTTGAGDDQLTGGAGDDLLIGGAGDDRIIAGGGGDTLDGGAGNDFLNGGGGSDIFKFAFTLDQSAGSTQFFRDGDTPGDNADQHAWDVYTQQLADWRTLLGTEFGADTDTTVSLLGTYKTGNAHDGFVTHQVFGDNSYTTGGGTVMDGEGDDQIAQLTRNSIQHDQIQISGVAADDFLAHTTLTHVDVDGNGSIDTLLTFDGSGSFAILDDASFNSVQAMIDDGYIAFV
jgi:Ca2+-binding RTX toxin-like protein